VRGISLNLAPHQRVLDACAAPGGKTALIAEREPSLEKLLAIDIDPHRLSRVRQNLGRENLTADVLVGDATAPRSGGMARRSIEYCSTRPARA